MRLKMIKSGIYKIINIINNKFYIGSAINFYIRWNRHKNNLRKGLHVNKILQNSWNKYGQENFKFEIVEEILDKSKLIEREQYYLDLLKPEYNICLYAESPKCAMLGKKHSEKTKEKQSIAKIGILRSNETKQKISNSLKGEKSFNYGKRFSEETRQKMSIKASSGKNKGQNNPMSRTNIEKRRIAKNDYNKSI